jgi:hypothetical protein
MSPPELTREQKMAIAKMLRGDDGGLFVAVRPVETAGPPRFGLPDGTHCIVPPTYADVSGKSASIRELFDELQAGDLHVTTYELTSLNVLLDRFATHSGFQRAAVEHYVRPELRNPLRVDVSESRPNYEFIINTLGSMIALKGAIGVERPIGPVLPSPFKTGDLILRANQFVSGPGFDGMIVHQTDADLAAETISTWDLTNPRDIGYEPARVSRMLELLDSPDHKVKTLREKLGIVRAELRFAGLPIVDFLALVFGLFALARSVVPDEALGSGSV